MATEINKQETYSKWTKWGTLSILCFINLINYMDRYTIVGVLSAVMVEFEIEEAKAGLLQTVFLISYIIISPIAGYLGDRYNRKIIVLFGLIFWSCVVLASSFISGNQNFILFLSTRAMVGIGEATYSCIAPTGYFR